MSETPRHRLDYVFRPRSVCMVGISADAHKLNGAPLGILRQHGFSGQIELVNPKYDEIAGLRCHRRLHDVPHGMDLAFLMLPAADVPQALEDAADRGMKGAIVLSSGFEEVADGAGLARRVRDICRDRGIALIGPNCEGVWSVRAKAILTFGSAARREVMHHAPLAIVSQSGAISGAIGRHLQDEGYGCGYVVSVGNETDTSMLEVMDWLLDQEDVRHVLLFLEGLRDGWRLCEVAAKARARAITIVALKSGNSAAGQEAAASHTGKIATPFGIYRDIFAQHGIIAVDSLAELVEAGRMLPHLPPLRRAPGAHPGISVCSVPGGTRALTADACADLGVPMARFETATVAALTAVLPRFGYAQNPTDLTGQILSRPAMLDEALGMVAGDPNTEAMVVQFANRGLRDARDRAPAMAAVAAHHGTPIIVSLLADEMPAAERRAAVAQGIGVVRDPREAVRLLSWLYRRDRPLAGHEAEAAPPPPLAAPDGSWASMARFLGALGIGVPPWRVLRDDVAVLAGLNFPLAAKALPEAVAHKTELGAVVLNLRDRAGLIAAAARIRERLGDPSAPLLVQEMVTGGVEATLSVARNPDFGALLAIGSGGVMVELFQDLAQLLLPASPGQVEAAIERLRLAPLLRGFRGAAPADHAALVRAAVALGQAFLALPPAVLEIELNPVFVLPKGRGVVAVDMLFRAKELPL
jgi:acyl-CoA synthetase (NDP forming)